jgi:uncharacterized protein DUF4268
VSPTIFVESPSGQLVPLTQQDYEAEKVLQKLLAQYPSLLGGDADGTERRYLLVRREVGIPGQEGGGSKWSLDHLFLDQDGIPTLVEVKRSTDGRIRREVVGQMLDYAANAVLYWPLKKIAEDFRATCLEARLDPEIVLGDHLEGSELDAEGFWERVGTNLKAKKIRLLFVADRIPPELRRIVEFLNEQMSTSEVLAIEVKRYGSDQGLRTFVANVIGNTATASSAKDGSQVIGPKGQLYAQFWPQVMERLRREAPGWLSNKKTPTWYGLGLPAGRSGLWYVLQFTQTKRLRVRLMIQGHAVKGLPAPAFELLQKQREVIEKRFGAPLEWQQTEGQERTHIAFTREGEAEVEQMDQWPTYEGWLVTTAVRLREALQPAINALGVQLEE